VVESDDVWSKTISNNAPFAIENVASVPVYVIVIVT
jgi:hypothetical protein